MPKFFTRWQAHDATNYDRDMTARCATPQSEIVADPPRRQAILADPRDLHRELFGPFTPPSHSEYAGTYRATPATTLAERRMCSASPLEPDAEY